MKLKINKYIPLFLLVAACKVTDEKDSIEKIDTLVFNSCRIEFPVYKNGGLFLYEGHSIPNEYEYESAQRKLAICLCEKYLTHPDDTLKTKILELYHSKGHFFYIDTSLNIEFDSIVLNRNLIFNPEILID